MGTLKVIYFHQYFSTPQGAAGTRSYEMARRLVLRGHQVLMVCGTADRSQSGLEMAFVRGRRRGIVDGIEVLEFELEYSNRDGFARRTIAFARFAARSVLVALTEPYDLTFATTTPLTAALPGIASRWIRRKRFVFEVRDLWPELPRAMGVIRNPAVLGLMSALEWAAYRSAHRLIGLAPGIVDGIVRRGVRRERVEMIPNGCDLETFGRNDHPWRPEGVGARDLMAVFTGAHGQANGLDAVLDAAVELMRRNRRDIKLVLVGSGKQKLALERRAAGEGLSSVIFHEPVSKMRLAGLMASADIGLQTLANVSAFYLGTSPNKFFDYIAGGLPVLINYPGWLADLVATRNCGFAVPPANPIAFADALVHAADDRSGLRRMGQNARELAAAEFDRNTLGRRFVACLEVAARA